MPRNADPATAVHNIDRRPLERQAFLPASGVEVGRAAEIVTEQDSKLVSRSKSIFRAFHSRCRVCSRLKSVAGFVFWCQNLNGRGKQAMDAFNL
jgi:hypothetical protein